MGTQSQTIDRAGPAQHGLTLRELQQEAIVPLMATTAAIGVGLIVLAGVFADPTQAVFLGLWLQVIAVTAHWLLGRNYLAGTWLLLIAWAAGAVVAVLWYPNTAAPCLLALPVGIAALFVGPLAGLATGLAISAVAVAAAWLAVPPVASSSWLILTGLIWGVYIPAWLSSRPAHTAIGWSWHSYVQARCQLERARDRQAELNQAVRNLADANRQMARLTQLLGAARQAAEEAERVKAEFVANVSHELRTPLNMIIGFAEMIVEAPSTYGVRLPPALVADVAAIHRNSQHLANLINDVLDISQVEARRMSLSKEWVSLAEIVDAAVLAVRPFFESRGLYLHTDLPADLAPIYCDRTRIRQVLLNLLSNAGRFTETGGVTVQARSNDQEITVTVSDTGPGIAEQDLHRVFEPFQQLDSTMRRKQGGSGLGLNISRRFVELHGGRMGVQSRVGEGSSFWFSLPLQEPLPDAAGVVRWLRSEWEWEQHRHSSLLPRTPLVPRIVILETEGLLEDATRRYLDCVEVEVASSPEQVQSLLQAGPAQVLLVCGETPEQTAAWLDKVHDLPQTTPIVACTLPAGSGPECLGAAGYLTKPVTRSQLLDAIAGLEVPVRSILLVDDDPEALQLFGRILSTAHQHHLVLQASSGQEAMDLLRARHPDLLLLDLAMPGMDGFAVLEKKNQDPNLRDIPTLILSARDPNGQPVVAPSVLATRSGGLSLPDLLRTALAVSEMLAVPRPAPPAVPPAMPGA